MNNGNDLPTPAAEGGISDEKVINNKEWPYMNQIVTEVRG
jgi:hypothetical protein